MQDAQRRNYEKEQKIKEKHDKEMKNVLYKKVLLFKLSIKGYQNVKY